MINVLKINCGLLPILSPLYHSFMCCEQSVKIYIQNDFLFINTCTRGSDECVYVWVRVCMTD